MKNSDLVDKIKRLLQREKRYKADAYEFVNAAVNYAASLENSDEKKHIAALELLEGVRDFAFRQYGPFAAEVLKSWGLNTASDIGNIVFLLIDEKALFAGENDSPEDFNVDFDLFKSFRETMSRKTANDIKVPKIV
jgi:uncharacterized repeat protein (TIGR04138 family)